jgi:pimeloyl-ACP methyl ester carboxylesterase
MTGAGDHRRVVLFGERIAYRQLGDRGPVVVLLHGLADIGHSGQPAAHLPTDGSGGATRFSFPTCSDTGCRPSRAPTTPAVRTPTCGATCSTSSGMTGSAWSGTRSAAGSRCSSPTVPAAARGADAGGQRRAGRRRRRVAAGGCTTGLRTGPATAHRAAPRAADHRRARRRARARALPALGDVDDVLRISGSLDSTEARAAVLATLRGVIDPAGQRVSAINRPPDAAQTPTLLVWGGRDPIIPVRHARRPHELMPGSRRAIFPEAGHFPHRHDPARFAEYSWTSSTALTAQQSGRPARWPRRPGP